MKITKRLTTLCTASMMAVLLSACGSDVATRVKSEVDPNKTPAGNSETSATTAPVSADNGSGKIADQSFAITLPTIGEAEFVSYSPDLKKDANADVTFDIEKDGKKVQELDGMIATNIRNGVTFQKVEAVSFKDFNGDGSKDIITICKYKKSDAEFSEARIYRGKSNGRFTFDKQLSNDSNAALAEITVQSVLTFLGVDVKNTDTKWKQAYIDIVTKDKNVTPSWAGYALIQVDSDGIPELVKIGSTEAMGCMIVNYSGGKTWETQLQRRNFTYIPEANYLCNSDGNMDHYYDSVYRMGKEKLTLVHAGTYGVLDNSNAKVDEQGKPIYEYKWNGKLVSKEEYQKQLNAVYDTKKAKPGYTEGKYANADNIINQIQNF